MEDSLVIRLAEASDEEVLYEMICRLENARLNRVDFNRVFQINRTAGNISYFLAESNGKFIGMVSCHIQPLLHHVALVAEIQELYVFDTFRSQGIGKALLDRVAFVAESMGAVQLEVTSRATRRDAHRFYEREGFQKSHVKLVRYFK